MFYSQDGRRWMVAKAGSRLEVHGGCVEDEKLYEIARSCAYHVEVAATRAGGPSATVNEERRMSSTFWEKGEEPVSRACDAPTA